MKKQIFKICIIIFSIATLLFATLNLLNIYKSDLYILFLGLNSLANGLKEIDVDKKYGIIFIVISIILIISFILM